MEHIYIYIHNFSHLWGMPIDLTTLELEPIRSLTIWGVLI